MEPLLTNASINFHTNDEDKDDDTHVTITVKDENGTTAARLDSNFSHFSDHSDAGPYPLAIRSSSGKALMQRGSITIRVDPNGHDTWRFNWELDLHFSDGSHLGAAVTGNQLSQNAKQDTWGLQGIIRE